MTQAGRTPAGTTGAGRPAVGQRALVAGAEYAGRAVVVAGAGIAGAACADVLLALGAAVTVVDRRDSDRLAELAGKGARAVVTDEPPADLLDGASDLVVSPGIRPSHPLALAGVERGLDVYSEPELAWRIAVPRPAPVATAEPARLASLAEPGGPIPWLAITGTNGKTTTTTMLAAILAAAGLRTEALGNIGEPLVYAVREPDRYDVLAVELSSQQLHWSSTMAPRGGALLNLADDHLDWHGSFDTYAGAKAAIWRSAGRPTSRGGPSGGPAPGGPAPGGVAVGNLDDLRVAAMLGSVAGRTVGFTLGEPAPGQVGVVDGMLVDRAFTASDASAVDTGVLSTSVLSAGVELVPAELVRPAGRHNVANALAAAALARSFGVPAAAVAAGLTGYTPEPHRNAAVTTIAGVRYVDDSKATNPHAALASLTSYPSVVWVAGGQLKGVDPDELVASVAGRLRGAVLLGVDRARVAAALARHAPQIPVIDVARTDDGAMTEVVRAAAGLARPGDTVLLAPAAASYDMFSGYGQRGDRFAAAARELAAEPAG
jgi:UDP-N-acetylmuramoylalanine--D-glutamate ligase